MQIIADYLHDNKERLEATLFELLRIPSISAQTAHQADSERTVDWLVEYFNRIGFSTQVFPTIGNPLIYAESPKFEGAPTLLIYGHYDVQPVDPLDEWETPPFEPTVRDGMVYARGATDDKGPLLAHIIAAEFWMQSENRPKINVKFFLEGNEEGGDNNITQFLHDNADLLACDYLALSDSSQFAPGQPAISCGFRGICGYELTLRGPKQDLHSGTFGGAVSNPATVLTRVLASFKDADGHVLVPGFYDDVQRLSADEQAQYDALPFDDEEFYRSVGAPGGEGEKDVPTLSRLWLRPTFDINGITGGYQGQGSKTIIPAWASAKFSFRLVPNQNPDKLWESLEKYVADQLPIGITAEWKHFSHVPGFSVDTTRPCMKAAASAVEFGFNRSPVFIRDGGSIPVVLTFSQVLTTNVMMIGLSQSTDNAHSPNEHWSMADFYRGIKMAVRLWYELAAIGK